MNGLVMFAIGSVGLLNAGFIGVVLAEMASPAVGVAGGLATLVVESLIVRRVRQAIAASSSSSTSRQEGRA